jgi:regulatory protein
VDRPERTITQVEALKRPQGLSAVYVDGELALRARTKIVVALGLRAGRVLQPGTLAHLLDMAREEDALAEALESLAGRDRTETELRQRLGRKGFPQPIVATVLDRLRQKGLIDDHRYAKEYVRTQSVRRGLGPEALRARLARLGVAPSTVDEALVQEMPDENQMALAEAIARRQRMRLRSLEGDRLRARIYAHLLRRGFPYDVAAEVSERLLESE